MENFTDFPVCLEAKSFASTKVITMIVPLNSCPSESCQTATLCPNNSTVIRKTLFEQKNDAIQTHFIGKWTIRESSKPFAQAQSTAKSGDGRTDFIQSLRLLRPTLSNDVKQWTVSDSAEESIRISTADYKQTDDVCVFFEFVLDKSSYAPIIKEHLIDGVALLLLKDEHLEKIFHMNLGPRLKLMNRIKELDSFDVFLP